MDDQIEKIVAQYSTASSVIRELHDVPPYRVYEVELDTQRAVVKVDDHRRGHAADEGRVHEYVATETTASVPEVIAVGSDHYITVCRDEIVREATQIDPGWAHAAGVWMATLHGDTAGAFDGFGQPRNDGTSLSLAAHDTWTDAVIERSRHHRQYLATKGYADVADAVEAFFRDHPCVFDGVGEPVLCHGDIHPEHLSRTSEGGCIAIDFEHALVAPAAYDYWRTVMPYFEASDAVDETVTRAFQDGYESVRPLPNGFEERRPLYRLLNWVAFLESLYLQQNVDPDKREEIGDWMQTRAYETLSEVRETVD
ncbi:APH family phosphotransferase [Natrialba magadii ATCC 43099]|uniref:APH family phosphotransferase n=1 Tax=Natrialba magadii (strain ATCC 43099 / DSM 3394 / CCM 3739 / CIP 104546 / IAM 13178 / JCM 8861 / NBRC 102185 / NCIMB 2190 / MS3) TaxID=547559 RepID=D3STQ9_NATMM|nr:phosphotransferase [Natrialba magadii]ADD05076.1 APH family phosphotransferase [Natrialba magadii ATCC 43099]ELY23311.1 aminoglycoside phosphotransferase [Natrialba magadii ATCC 43099]